MRERHNQLRLVASRDLANLDVGAVATAIGVDDADRTSPGDEATLFHLHNHLAAAGLPLLLTAREAPSRWPTALPDLRSRMEAADIARIEAPDDALLSAVLMKLFHDRQIVVTPPTIAWLTAHMDRSFAEAQRVVAALDARALAEGRKVTRDLAQELLETDIG